MRTLVIIGGGLSGLALAYYLKNKGTEAVILEASPRIGGRIFTISGRLGTPLELGATWFSEEHPNLISLISDLGLKKFVQYAKGISLFQTKSFEPVQKFFVPESEAPSYRVAGGTEMLIKALSEKIPAESVKLRAKAVAIRNTGRELAVETAGGDVYTSKTVISCIPPQLAASQIEFTPKLPEPVTGILSDVQTWMAGAIKFALEYEQPFWRTLGYSGMLYSHAGIIVEMYDHTNFENNKFGLTGFLNGSAATYPPETRREFVLRQLTELIGSKIPGPTRYFDKVWNDNLVLQGNPIVLRPHQNNGHPALRSSYMNDRFHFCGSETAAEFPGYMEGALRAAKFVANKL